mmetsp:Transcript_35617/g.58143  ORF Transcript_35617/g.58143 Transcript_35617/m.58143 type:complete len:120 (+) Transcript_35617:738-1097(+)
MLRLLLNTCLHMFVHDVAVAQSLCRHTPSHYCKGSGRSSLQLCSTLTQLYDQMQREMVHVVQGFWCWTVAVAQFIGVQASGPLRTLMELGKSNMLHLQEHVRWCTMMARVVPALCSLCL